MRLATTTLFLILSTVASATAQHTTETNRPLPKNGNFAPGVKINWPLHRVEVDATVVLREGPLELFACSPRTREHESILAVQARPIHIFQAMGLIALNPGSPIQLDKTAQEWKPPTGQKLTLLVQFYQGNLTYTEPIESWMLLQETGVPPSPLEWVFSGSRTRSTGRFAADTDGTVVTVVDFESALISVGSLHSADNELLWLKANTEVIPPLKTPCTLLIFAGRNEADTRQLSLDGTGRLRDQEDHILSVKEVAERFGDLASPKDRKSLVLYPKPQVPESVIVSMLQALHSAGIQDSRIELRRLVDRLHSKRKQGKQGNKQEKSERIESRGN